MTISHSRWRHVWLILAVALAILSTILVTLTVVQARQQSIRNCERVEDIKDLLRDWIRDESLLMVHGPISSPNAIFQAYYAKQLDRFRPKSCR